ncbi:trehalose synthase [Nanobdella aerobiophila]|uniref:Trehalose synthase n=1 Tax=Nanobdella aerobiophila TaxID=2586965 RepID=A0A915SY03_9ARCH|nr:glycosyltransferase family 4 protein [Nanobdella aerobiophila]BBL45440.1 trehalose synthase [Nanobdella aerobiophila]
MKKVIIEFPWNFIDSQYYKNLINYPPQGFIYLNKINRELLITNPKKFSSYVKLKEVGRRILQKTNISIPIIKFNKYNTDIVHCARCFSLRNNYVVDVEIYYSLVYDMSDLSSRRPYLNVVRNLLTRDNCKRILPWTYASYNTFPKEIRENKKIREKIDILYPAVPEHKIKSIKHEKITLLHIGRYFYGKGGLYILELYRKLKEKYDIETILISLTIPDILVKKYGKYGIKIYKSVSADKLYSNIFPSTDIFTYGSFSETFGFAMVEALSYKIPIITYDGFSKKEIIDEGKNGYIIPVKENYSIYKVNEELLNQFYEKTVELIENPSLLKEFSRNAYKKYKERFSIEVRNKKLKEIYEESID